MPRLISKFLQWISDESGAGPDWVKGYLALPDVAGDHSHPIFREWLAGKRFLNAMRSQLAKAKVFPFYHDFDDQSSFERPTKLALLPELLSNIFVDDIGMKAWILFGTDVVNRETLGERGTLLLERLGLVTMVESKWAAKKWGRGIGYWIEAIQSDDESSEPDDDVDDAPPTQRFNEAQAMALVKLWGALQELEGDDESKWKNDRLKCRPALAERWKCRADLSRLENFDLLQDGPLVRQALEGFQPSSKDLFDEDAFANYEWDLKNERDGYNFLE